MRQQHQQQYMQRQQINDYKLEGLLGEGAYGRVYLAEGVDGNKFALKLIQINKKIKDQIRQEGLMLASMKHPNILWAREFFFFDKEKYFVIITDYCKDGSLDNFIGEMEEARVRKVMLGVAEGLLYLHDTRNIVHRDLKPENILLDGDVPKIGDLGVAKILKTYKATTKIGTPVYMAFEMLEGDYDIEVDIWALGIIYLELLVGKRIVQLIKGQEIPSKRSNFPTPELLNKIKDQKMKKMVSEMLQKVPENRLKIAEVIAYLKEIKPIPQQQVARMSLNNQSGQNKSRSKDPVSDCYSKTEQFWFCKYSLKYMKQLYEKNLVTIEEQAEANNPKAQYILGKMYESGYGMSLNKTVANEWFQKAYFQYEPHASYQLYLHESNPLQKKLYFKNGLELEQIRCQYRLAECYLEGFDGYNKDLQVAESQIQQLCQKQYPRAYKLKGKLQSKKNTPYFDIQAANKSYQFGADLGDIECMLSLAQQLYKQKSLKEAMELTNKIESIEELDKTEIITGLELKAKIYWRMGDSKKAIEYFNKCIALDDGTLEKDFKGEIAWIYQQIGQFEQAINLFNETIYAMLPKFQTSSFFAARLKKICSKQQILLFQNKKYQNAYLIAKLSSDLGFDFGKADLAFMIYSGTGVAQDKSAGLKMLLDLSKQGNSEAQEYMDELNAGRY